MRWLWIPALALAVIWPRASAQTWSIDTDRASASFSVRPVWLRRIHGYFPILEGILVRDPASDTVAVDVRIDVRALQMGRAAWVIWAQSPEFFDVERHPWIRFRSDPFPVSQLPEGGLIFANFVDLDTDFGHRRDVAGYARGLEDFDARMGELLPLLRGGDLLILSADHGNDPTWRGTDHTREHVPVVGLRPDMKSIEIGKRKTFADVGASIAAHLGLAPTASGKSFLQ